MALMIDPERLKQIRTLRRLTQDELAKKARLNKQTISRLERDRNPIRTKNLDRLSEALEIDPKVLIGEASFPTEFGKPKDLMEGASSYQLNVRIRPAVRNAYELAARRYGVGVSKIAELAPLLFVILAEASLSRRASKLDECRTKIEELARVASELPYGSLPVLDEDLGWEQDSISKQDVLGRTLPHGEPFAEYLEAVAARYAPEDITIDAIGSTSVDYRVCRTAAVALADGDEVLADSLLNGEIMIHQMPRGLNPEQRITWMKEHRTAVGEIRRENPEDIPEELPKYHGRAIAIEL